MTSAYLEPVDGRWVRICDKYKQFTNVEIEVEELKSALRALMTEMRKSFVQEE